MIPRSGKTFRSMRLKLDLTQKRLASLFGVTEQMVHRWENAKTRLDGSAAILIWLLYDEQINGNRNAVRDFVRAR